jgi:hypothetical protein
VKMYKETYLLLLRNSNGGGGGGGGGGDAHGMSSVVVMNIFKVTGNHCTKVRRNKTVYHFFFNILFGDVPILIIFYPLL